MGMKITATLDYGSLEIELASEDREEIENELLAFVDFIESNKESLSKAVSGTDDKTETKSGVQTTLGTTDDSDPKETTSSLDISEITSRPHIDTQILDEFLKVPDDEEKVPYLYMDGFEEGEDVLGTSRRERQARASLLLLKAWKDLRDVDPVESEQLNESLHTSRINPDSRKNMYQAMDGDADDYFTRDFSGDVGLTQSGERAAEDEIERLVSSYEPE